MRLQRSLCAIFHLWGHKESPRNSPSSDGEQRAAGRVRPEAHGCGSVIGACRDLFMSMLMSRDTLGMTLDCDDR